MAKNTRRLPVRVTQASDILSEPEVNPGRKIVCCLRDWHRPVEQQERERNDPFGETGQQRLGHCRCLFSFLVHRIAVSYQVDLVNQFT